MDRILDDLTDAQRAAVTHVDGPMLMLAGPGSGKTRVVTRRMAYLLREGIPAHQILALTFTNKAAEEMQARVAQLAPGQSIWVSTFHRFCAQTLRRYAPLVGLQENYSILDMPDAKQTLKRAIDISGVSLSHTSAEQIAAQISRFKNELLMPEMVDGCNLRSGEIIPGKVYPFYQQQLLLSNAVDFDCMLLHVARLLRENPDLRRELDARYRYIMVDEYQDTNIAQYAIVRAMSIDHQNLAVTGDPDQSIYGWRGANLNNILDFEKDYPKVETVRLEQNYRSTPNILRVADQLITNNSRRKHKGLYTDNPEGSPVRLRIYSSGNEEAEDIADQIVHQIYEENRRPRDFAIFCRMNALTRTLEHSLRSRSVPYVIVRGVEFYQRKEIKDVLAYLQLINNPSHDVALLRVINTPTRGIGRTTQDRLIEFANSRQIPLLEAIRQCEECTAIKARPRGLLRQFGAMIDRLSMKASAALEDLLEYLLEETKYCDYLESGSVEEQDNSPTANVEELLSAAVEFDRQHPEDGSLELFLEQIALISDTDAWEDSSDRVALMTLHAAKGLEFPCVYIVGVEDEVLPHRRSRNDPMQYEEERRLLFVGITRAEEQLQLSTAKMRSMRGNFSPVAPSPFLMELPTEDIQLIDVGGFSDSSNSDDYSVDYEYPSDWDLDEPDDISQESPEDKAPTVSEARNSFSGSSSVNLQTAADLMKRQEESVDLDVYRVGMVVSHPEYGSGRIVSLSGIGKKRVAIVNFFIDSVERRFMIAFTPLTPEEE